LEPDIQLPFETLPPFNECAATKQIRHKVSGEITGVASCLVFASNCGQR
jgi:hypothetical protein